MKTTLKQITVGTFIALLLMVGNVKASETEATSLKATETSLQLENWMTNETIWNNNTIKTIDFVQETETSLELESWMTSDETWKVEDMDVEPELTVENWMINDNIWE